MDPEFCRNQICFKHSWQSLMLSPLLNEKGTNIIQEMYHHGTKIDNALTMIQTAISIANEKSQPIPIKSMTNDILKGAKLSGQESIDISSVYECLRYPIPALSKLWKKKTHM